MNTGMAAGERNEADARDVSADGRTRIVLFLWGTLRLPAAAVALYVARNPLVDLIERRLDILSATRFVIDVLSTPLTRGLLAAAFAGALVGCAAATRRLRPFPAWVAMLVTGSALVAVAGQLTDTTARRGLVVVAGLALSLLPRALPRVLERYSSAWDRFMLWGVLVAEILFARDYWLWLRARLRGHRTLNGGRVSIAAAIPAILIAAVALGVLVRGHALLPLEQRIRMSPDARVLDRGLSFNWIELDESGSRLYVTGHSVRFLRRYDVSTSAVDLESGVATGGAQGFAYDPSAATIYTFNTWTRQLLYLDATTLRLVRTIDLPTLSPGDPWIVADPVTDTLTIVSEADIVTGDPFIVLDRRTGAIIGREPLDAGNVLRHPGQPWIYLTFFRRRSEVVAYDLEAGAIRRRAPADARAERMVFWAAMNELLVTSPLQSRVLRYDADDLSPKGFIPALFGVRAIAIDETRGLLLCGNLATGHLIVVDARSGRTVARHYLGPWLRTIELNPSAGMAYVSSNGALYELRYAAASAGARREERAP